MGFNVANELNNYWVVRYFAWAYADVFPHSYKAQFKNNNVALIIEVFLILLGVYLTYKAYSPIQKLK
jgi:hypothetical protein